MGRLNLVKNAMFLNSNKLIDSTNKCYRWNEICTCLWFKSSLNCREQNNITLKLHSLGQVVLVWISDQELPICWPWASNCSALQFPHVQNEVMIMILESTVWRGGIKAVITYIVLRTVPGKVNTLLPVCYTHYYAIIHPIEMETEAQGS